MTEYLWYLARGRWPARSRRWWRRSRAGRRGRATRRGWWCTPALAAPRPWSKTWKRWRTWHWWLATAPVGFARPVPRDEPGTFLATASGAVRRPGVLEVPRGIAIQEVLQRCGGVTEPLSAVLVGGFHGAWVPALDTAMTKEALGRFGAAPGAGVMVAWPASGCALDYTAAVMSYLAGQSAGQCGPCLNGLPRLAHTMTLLARRDRNPRLPTQIERLTALVSGRGACHHPDGSARLVASTLRVFAADVRAHLSGGCRAGGRAR